MTMDERTARAFANVQTIPELAEQLREVLSQFHTREARYMVAGEAIEHFGRVLLELEPSDKVLVLAGETIGRVGKGLFGVGARRAVKKGDPPEAG